MTMNPGRPPSNDPPRKYAEAWEMCLLSLADTAQRRTAAERVAAFLEWAISTEQAGFAVGDIIAVGALAEGVGRSRNTAAKAVERLVQRGMVVQERAKSPYRIVSTMPVFTDNSGIADEQISLTLKVESTSLISPVMPLDLGDGGNPFVRYLGEELAASGDKLIRRAAQSWTGGEIQCFQRLRTLGDGARPDACLAEITYVRLDGLTGAGFRTRIGRLRAEHVTRISLYAVLEQSGLHDVRAGRSQVTVGRPPALLGPALASFAPPDEVDHEVFSGERPLLKWTYGLFRPDPQPMVSFSVCYIRTDLLGVFIRSLDVERLEF